MLIPIINLDLFPIKMLIKIDLSQKFETLVYFRSTSCLNEKLGDTRTVNLSRIKKSLSTISEKNVISRFPALS